MFVSRAFLGFLSLDSCVCISRTFRISFVGLLCSYLAHFQNSLSLDYCVCIQRTFRILFHWIVAFVSRALIGFPIICIICKYFHQYLAQFEESRSFDYYLSISWDFFFMRSSCQYVEHFQDSLSMDSCVCISRTFRILFSLDFYISISRTLRILFHQIVTFVSRALLGFSFIGLLRLYLEHFQDFLSFDCYASIPCTFGMLYHWIVAFVSRALLGFPIISLLHQFIT